MPLHRRSQPNGGRSGPPVGRQRLGGRLLAAVPFLLAAACGDPAGVETGGILLVVPDDGAPLTDLLVAQATDYLGLLAGSAPQVLRHNVADFAALKEAARDRRAALVIALDASFDLATARPPNADLGQEGFHLQGDTVGDWDNRWLSQGATVLLSRSASPLARQYALYEILRRLGCRFYHPEQAYVPRQAPADLRRFALRATALAHKGPEGPLQVYRPDFSERGFTFHGSHPLEHLESFSDSDHPIDEARNVNLWIVQNRANHFRGAGRGVAPPARRSQRAQELNGLAKLLDLHSGGGITLHNEQQGSSASIDPTSATPIQTQIEAHVDKQMSGTGWLRWFGIHFGPTELTVTPDQETVDWINWAGQRALAKDPKTTILINNHITGSQPTPGFDDLGCPPGTNSEGRGDYYDLAFHTDPRFGVKVHTVMFYPLEGPARVYNQQSFAHKLCLMQGASKLGRPLWWFPEGSWWLSFDNPIPVYLPLYIWTRGRDVELVRPLLKSRGGGTLVGHRMFNSGHEWGYWQQDYAVGMWHWNADVALADVLGELFDPLCAPARLADGCPARAEAVAVLQEVMTAQKAAFLDDKDWQGLPGGRFSYFSGEDPADEIALATGLGFRPVRVAFKVASGWTDKEVKHFQDGDLAALVGADQQYGAWLARLAAIAEAIPTAGRPWLGEVVDGLTINQLRARQTLQLYGAVLAWREAKLAREAAARPQDLPAPAQAAAALLSAAGETLAAAEAVIARREAAYRYPAAQTHGGGLTPETAVDNGTTYPWRVHTKTHLLTYWHNRHQRANDLILGQASLAPITLALKPAIASPGVPLQAAWPALPTLTAKVSMGDGSTLGAGAKGHDYGAASGWWSIGGSLSSDGQELPIQGHVARSEHIGRSASGSFTLLEPDSAIAKGVLKSLVPPLRWARVAQPEPALLLAPDNDEGLVDFKVTYLAPLPAATSDTFATAPITFNLPLAAPGSGEAVLPVGLQAVVLSGDLPDKGLPAQVVMTGKLRLADLAKALISLAGFDEAGALKTLSGVLGFDPNDPPQAVPFKASVAIAPEATDRGETP